MIRLNNFLIAALFFIASTQILIGEISKDISHPAGTECQQCHMGGERTTQKNAYLLLSSQEKLCSSCHENALKISHPSGFNPGRTIPEGFPLDWKNEITCSTCHNIHASKHASIRGGISGKELCLGCHEMSFFRAMASNSLALQNTTGTPGWKHSYTTTDKLSNECMGCHANNNDSKTITIDDRGIIKHGSGINHPVDVIYSKTSKQVGYRPRSEIPGYIQLPGGRISCISCHTGYGNDHTTTLQKKPAPVACDACHIM